jgi:hypothetical protein
MRERITQSDVSVTRTLYGAYECAAIVDGTRVHVTYYFRTKREAVRSFLAWVNYGKREG